MRQLCFAVALAALSLAGCSTPSKPPVNTYLLGEKAQLGRLNYTVFETQWLTHIGEGATARIPENRFFLVRLAVVNGSGQDVSLPNLTIVDDQGKSYEELTNGEGVPQWAGYLRTVRPADTSQGNILFDAPPGHYKLKIWDENRSAEGIVDVPLTFGAETPEIPNPAEKK